MSESKDKPSEMRSFAIKAFTAFVIVVAGLLVLAFFHQILRVLVLTFTAALFAVLLTALTNLAMRLTKLPRAASMVVVILALMGLFIVTTLFIGSSIREAIRDLRQNLPEAIEAMKARLAADGAATAPATAAGTATASAASKPAGENWMVDQLTSLQGHFQEFVTFDAISNPVALGIAGSTVGVIGSLLVVFVVGIYLASSPDTYLNGVASLFPIKSRQRVKEVMKAVGTTLQWWLFGQFLAMLGVFILTYTGLRILGFSRTLGLALALLAGLFNLIPNFGPILAALPALILAVAPHGDNPNFDLQRVVYVAILYVVVQAIDGNVTSPIIQKRAVSLPPALTMLGQIAAFLLLGPVGLLLATPILAATLVLVRKAYIEDVLGDKPELKPVKP
jgi:predicted PurR-regulated permease PerM